MGRHLIWTYLRHHADEAVVDTNAQGKHAVREERQRAGCARVYARGYMNDAHKKSFVLV
jgi:hypothetical protein